jgi:ketosteroid isomerase-like protein
MSTSDLGQYIERYHRALDAFVQGNPEPVKQLFSRRDDVTLANPLGPPVRGWSQVAEAIDRAASQVREGETVRFEIISEYATEDLAYNLELEKARAKTVGTDEFGDIALRVTTIYRREDGEWKIIHRHADPITAPRPIESVLQH